MPDEDFRNIRHRPVGDRTDDPEALKIDESNAIFTQGLRLARKGNFAVGAEKIAQAFLLHEEGIKYFPIHQVSNFHDVSMDHGFLLKMIQHKSVNDLVCKILHIIPGICHESCIKDKRCTQQNLMARAMKETESILQMIENKQSFPLFEIFGRKITRKKFLYFQGSIYSSIGNRQYADKCYTSVLQIDPSCLKARTKRTILRQNFETISIEDSYKEMKELVELMHPDCVDLEQVCSTISFLALKFPKLGNLQEVRLYFDKFVEALERKRNIYTHKKFPNPRVNEMRRMLADEKFMKARRDMDENMKSVILPDQTVTVEYPDKFSFSCMYTLPDRSPSLFSCVRCRTVLTDPKKYGKCQYCMCVYFCNQKCFDADKFDHKPMCFAIQSCKKTQEARFELDQGLFELDHQLGDLNDLEKLGDLNDLGKLGELSNGWFGEIEPSPDVPTTLSKSTVKTGLDESNSSKEDMDKRQELQPGSSDLQHLDGSKKETLPDSKAKDTQSSIIQIQSFFRGILTRKLKLSQEVAHLSDFRRFYKRWGSCFAPAILADSKDIDWAALKEKQAFIRRQDILLQDDDSKDTKQRLDDAMTLALTSGTECHESDSNIETEEIEYKFGPTYNDGPRKVVRKIHLTADTEKWLRTCDSKYRDFFIRRIKQLASGDTSRILRKRLKGSTRTIYEVYLEQKSGFRILWTEEGDQVLIWYVAKHKNVSRLIKLIDDSRNRSNRTRVYIDDVEGLDDINASIMKNNKDRKEILLDPLGNVPLKRYEVTIDNIDELSTGEWKSCLVLTEEERDVVETKGTVLLLGRSGTGKTICICNRMEYDRQIHKERAKFTQLFVARSAKLCRYVEGIVGSRDGCQMVTFHDLRDLLENELPTHENIQFDYSNRSNKYMDFFRFKKEMFSNGAEDIDPLVVWTNIRSFIKGSIEALRSERGYLSKEEYLAFGKKRCRFSEEQRETIYDIFQRYQEFMDANALWDENDRIIALLRRLKLAREANPELLHNDCKTWAKFDKVYVDEVQDYTQVEILLFFMLGGAGNLFLAGDPAQNVARGVEFRFADIRSVGYYVAGNDEGKKELIPQKPKMVNINFRSHAGILQCAASILAEMFHHFPDSVKMLKKDAGLFQGPRPEVLPAVDASLLQDLTKSKLNGVVVLTHDENVEQVKKKLGGYELVYGIRHCKGLEFKSVIIMDFFSNISSDLQTPWKEMLLHRADNLYSNNFALQYPEIEAQLKLLYTAVTRCIERLFFVEETSSKAGDAFIRWSTTTSVTPFDPHDKIDKAIATLSECTNIESMGMNRDEWLAAGLSNAEAADAEEYDFENKCSFLKKAVYCFEQGRHDLFVRKAKAQLRSIELRMKVLDITVEDLEVLRQIEKEALCIIRGLLEADMGSEVLELCRSLRGIMNDLYPSSDFLQRYLVMNVQSICASQRKIERELCDQNELLSKPSAQESPRESISECAADKKCQKMKQKETNSKRQNLWTIVLVQLFKVYFHRLNFYLI
ncbi:P-loop containing nucleoside triphosphate hydrolase protein [Chaetoceros tenuissimus]|uniref:P-loop containing nucleoside triphosphate hydrolase protein n=1 Tax=Chaetoceros tenuissimus TaxID=426638 RepID=A0AAD3GZ51_9STRA|nr:P-loop containing nucleoside triphosphate hydrolase protein [Chaetoceros tenuissimus]